MAKQYDIVSNFEGYVSLPDKTNVSERSLVSGSQNVLINDEEKIVTRKGTSIFGATSTNRNAIESAFTWNTSTGTELAMRSYDDELEAYLGTIDGVAVDAWTRIADGWSAVDFVYTTWWDTAETLDYLLFVNGDSNIYEWSGGVTTLASATSNTLTKNGTGTWANARFLTAGTRKVLINGTEYTYTGGESTTTLTGVTPDPSGEATDSVVTQVVQTNSNTPASGFENDVIATRNNQVWVGSNSDNEVYVSADDNFTDYTFSTPRVPGDGALLTLNDVTNGFANFKKDMVVFSGRSDIYASEFEQLDVSGVLTETLRIKKLKTTTDQSAQSQGLITEMGDMVAFVTFEPTLRILSDIENIDDPQIRAFSTPIKPDFDLADFSNGDMLFDENRLHISAPADGNVWILEFRENAQGEVTRFWQPPQILPIRKFSIISDEIHGHNNNVPETYQLFTGTNDGMGGESLPFKAIAALAYRSFGDRPNHKRLTEWYTEGYIRTNTKLTLRLNYDLDGSTKTLEKEIDGTDTSLRFESEVLGSLGQTPLGQSALGGGQEDVTQLPKFRHIAHVVPTNFHEVQPVYETNALDYQWEILATGANIARARAQFIRNKR